MSVPEQREERIKLLLETLRDAQFGRLNAMPGDLGSKTVGFDEHLYHAGSYAELEKCLDAMNTEEPYEGWPLRRLRFHVTGYYAGGKQMTLVCNAAACRGLERAARQACDRPDHQGHKKPIAERVTVRSARVDLADLGVHFIAVSLWDLFCEHEPFLPAEIWQAIGV